MNYRVLITRDGNTIHDAEISADAVIDLMAVQSELPSSPSPKRNPPNDALAIGNAKWQKLTEKSPRSKLTDSQKVEIERLLKEEVSVKEIAERYKVSEPTIYLIKTRLKKEGRL